MQKEAFLYDNVEENKVKCRLCPHGCLIKPDQFGICGVRQNKEGSLYTYAYANPLGVNIDPIEKKPLYHFLPGTTSFSIGTAGCNFKCSFCQNWRISQVTDTLKQYFDSDEWPPQKVADQAEAQGCKSVAYTYTEPTIFFEYAYDTSVKAQEKGLKNIFVTNGFITTEAVDMIRPYLDAANVDLKSFRDDFYKKVCKGRLQPVLDAIRHMYTIGIWVEITTLIIPGQNDSEKEIDEIAQFIADTGKEIPWHISRFFPQYKYTDAEATPLETLHFAERTGSKKGLEHIHLGNV